MILQTSRTVNTWTDMQLMKYKLEQALPTDHSD